MAVKLLFSWPDGKVLGGQIIGYDGVDKRIDVISTAMRSRLTVFELERLELAYAPMYLSAKGPVNIPADSLRDGLHELPREKAFYVYCQVGLRGYVALRILTQHEFAKVRNLSGGYTTYQLAMQKQSNEDIYGNETILRDDSIQAAP